MAYKPIESYGVIGDLHTVALVSMDGSIDWCCLPHFDSPSIFAAILDERKGGFFKIASLYEAQHKQMYLPDSNVLLTRFLSPEGVGEVVDFMPIQDASRGKKVHQIVRVVRAVRGAVRFRLECQPAFDYARQPHQITLEGRGAVFEAPGMRFSLVSRFPLARQGTGHRVPAAPGRAIDVHPAPHRRRWRLWAVGGAPRRHRAADPDPRVLAPLAAQVSLPGPLARDGQPLSLDAEAADFRADRGDRRGTNLQPSRRDRRGAQLGLPLHLGPRRGFHPLRLPTLGVDERGRAVHGLAGAARHRRSPPWPLADHVRHRRPPPIARGSTRPSGGLPRLAPGAHRQRRLRTAPARHLR